MSLADREYMYTRKEYPIKKERISKTFQNKKLPSYRIYRLRRFILRIKNKFHLITNET